MKQTKNIQKIDNIMSKKKGLTKTRQKTYKKYTHIVRQAA